MLMGKDCLTIVHYISVYLLLFGEFAYHFSWYMTKPLIQMILNYRDWLNLLLLVVQARQ